MSAIKEDNKWYIRGKYKLEDGSYKYYHKVAKNCKYKVDAKEYERIFLGKISNEIQSKAFLNFKELSELYISSMSTQKKEVSILTDKNCLQVINESIGNKKVNLIYKITLQNFINDIDNKYSQSYTSKIYYTINKIFNYGVGHDYVLTNPMTNVLLPLHKGFLKSEMLFWTSDDFNQFISNIKVQDIYYVMFNFLYYMGCRKGEMLALTWNDVNLKTGKVKIYKTVSFKNTDCIWKLTTPKTKNSIRTIEMPQILLDIMVMWYSKQSVIFGFNSDCFIFGYDRPCAPENLRRILTKEIIRINLDNSLNIPLIRVHDFRHSHASYLISRKLYDYDIARRLGDTVNTVHDVYAHWFVNAESDIMSVMNSDFNNE